MSTKATALDAICREIAGGRRFLLTSHARPDGDSVGSQLALAFALDHLGKQVRIVNADLRRAREEMVRLRERLDDLESYLAEIETDRRKSAASSKKGSDDDS